MVLSCPDAASLETVQADLSQHLESCASCRATLDKLATDGRSLMGLARDLHQNPNPLEPGLQRVLNEAAGAVPGETQEELGADKNEELAFLAPSSRPGTLGRLGHYEIQEVIGRGAFGIVFKAFDEQLHRVVAIKVLAPHIASNGTARKRFTREAQAAAAIANEHVVTIHAVEGDHNLPYLVMHFIAGMSLQEKLDQEGPLGLKEILRIGLQSADGLAAAHKQGLVHRDIKPANILLENGVERVRITDFGLARAMDDASLTQSGVIAGTPQYMAPEQARGEPLDHRADLFSLGSVLYALCTGRPPFRASGTHAVLKRVIDAAPRPIREINSEIPDGLCAIIAKLHAKKPEDRFQTASEVAELLGQHLAHLQQPGLVAMPAVVAVPDTVDFAATIARPPRKHLSRKLLAGALSVVLIVIALSVWLGPTVVCYLGNRGEMELVSQPGLTGVIVLQNDVIVTDGLDMRNSHTVKLSPGKYQLYAGCPLGFRIDGWEVTTSSLFVSRTVRHGGDSCELDVQRGERVTVRAVISATPQKLGQTAAADTQPFVVLRGNGQPERPFATLNDAVDKAQAGGTIEIRGNGPFQTVPMVLDKALTLRAGAGYEPVLVHTRDGTLLWTTAPLVLEGLEFHSVGNKHKGTESQWALIQANGTPLRIAQCRIRVKGDLMPIQTFASPLVEVKHSEVFSSNMNAIDCGLANRTRMVIQNCWLGGRYALALYQFGKPARDAEVEITDNTFVAATSIWDHRFHQDPVDSDKEAFRSVRVKAVGNVFHSRRWFGHVAYGDTDKPYRPDALADWYRAHITWEARDNLFAVKSYFLVFTEFGNHMTQEGTWKTSKDWQAFWKVEKNAGIEGAPRFAGGDLLARLEKDPLSLTPADFRLEKGSPGQGTAPEGKDLGADVDCIGPGPAYEKWQTTPQYQDWRKKTKELMNPP
jgi:Protein kinase domain